MFSEAGNDVGRFRSGQTPPGPDTDVWLPQTNASTARQQVQRSFAAELLAPIEDLFSYLGGTFSNDVFEDAGDYFGVSPLAIRSHLANHRIIPARGVGSA